MWIPQYVPSSRHRSSGRSMSSKAHKALPRLRSPGLLWMPAFRGSGETCRTPLHSIQHVEDNSGEEHSLRRRVAGRKIGQQGVGDSKPYTVLQRQSSKYGPGWTSTQRHSISCVDSVSTWRQIRAGVSDAIESGAVARVPTLQRLVLIAESNSRSRGTFSSQQEHSITAPVSVSQSGQA